MLVAEHVGQLGQRNVDLRDDRGQNDRSVGFDATRAQITAARFGAH